VQGWLAEGNFPSTEEFVESIPFTETREYVQAIMRNASLYRRLYTATSAGKSTPQATAQPAQD
jgi:soluble lytic murein transglycosylase